MIVLVNDRKTIRIFFNVLKKRKRKKKANRKKKKKKTGSYKETQHFTKVTWVVMEKWKQIDGRKGKMIERTKRKK